MREIPLDQPILIAASHTSPLGPKTLAGQGWQEFFHRLGQGTVTAEHRSPFPKLVQD